VARRRIPQGPGPIIRNFYALLISSVSNSNGALHYLDDCRRLMPLPASELCRSKFMQDILWVGLVLALLAASLGYAALCKNA
jgi:hypothetical protein